MSEIVTFFRAVLFMSVAALAPALGAFAQGVDVQLRVQEVNSGTPNTAGQVHTHSSTVVLWLSEVASGQLVNAHPPPPGRFRMTQKDRSFSPHLLVVPIGSTVEFPNLDPFFHNVFSQFNGKRFDLGLYEAGSSKGVRFDHEGVSYIFCNIHPQMGAVIVTLATPYSTIATGTGTVVFHNVPGGDYELHVWAEGADARQLDALTRRVHIDPSQNDLGSVRILTNNTLAPHKNKFGDDYLPDARVAY